MFWEESGQLCLMWLKGKQDRELAAGTGNTEIMGDLGKNRLHRVVGTRLTCSGMKTKWELENVALPTINSFQKFLMENREMQDGSKVRQMKISFKMGEY